MLGKASTSEHLYYLKASDFFKERIVHRFHTAKIQVVASVCACVCVCVVFETEKGVGGRGVGGGGRRERGSIITSGHVCYV